MRRGSSAGHFPLAKHQGNTQKGQIAVYVGEGEERKRYMIPVSYLNQPLFLDVLSRTEEEFGYDSPTGGLTIPCSKDTSSALMPQLRFFLGLIN